MDHQSGHHQLYVMPAVYQTTSLLCTSNPNPNPNPIPLPIPFFVPSYSHLIPSINAAVARGCDGYCAAASCSAPEEGRIGLVEHYLGNAGSGNPVQFQFMKGKARGKAKSMGLENKKKKLIQGGAAASSVRICTICNVVCNSDKVFVSHLAGEKHAMKALRSSEGKTQTLQNFVTPIHSVIEETQPASARGKSNCLKEVPNSIQSVYCDVCKIDCNRQEVLDNHKLGKKHRRNLQKLQDSIVPKPPNAPITCARNSSSAADEGEAVAVIQRKTKPATEEDLEMKKQKVLEGGAAADAVRVCSLCNVVCNSEKVFDFHITGQKHIAKFKKQQEAPIS